MGKSPRMLPHILPTGNTLLLTDAKRSLAVFVSSRSGFEQGAIISRGGLGILLRSWFGERICSIQEAGPPHVQKIDNWLDEHHGLEVRGRKPISGPVHARSFATARIIKVPGLKPVRVSEGRLLRRKVGRHLVFFHESGNALPEKIFPVMDAPLTILPSAENQLYYSMRPKPNTGYKSNICPACGGCAACAGCIVCGEQNFLVGSIGILGLTALASFAGHLGGRPPLRYKLPP